MKRVGYIVGCSMIALVLLASATSAQTTAEARADRAESRAEAPPPPPPPPPPAPAPSSMGSGSGGSGPSSGGYAVPRSPGDGGSIRGGSNRVGPRQGLEIANEDQQRRGGNSTGVPPYSRPRPEGRTASGSAAPRRTPPPSRNGGGTVYSPGYYYPYGIGAYGFGYYDPFLWSPYGFGYGSYYGYPGSFGYGAGYGGGYGGGYVYGGGSAYRESGSIRLKVKPVEAQIFVDGYYAGTVDDYDGVFQRLRLTTGAHRVEVRAPGYQSHSFEVQIVPGETITYRGDLVR